MTQLLLERAPGALAVLAREKAIHGGLEPLTVQRCVVHSEQPDRVHRNQATNMGFHYSPKGSVALADGED